MKPVSKSRKPKPDAARRVAFEILRAVQERDSYANLILPKELERADLDERDAAFATELTYGALRFKGQNETIAAQCVDRDWKQLDSPLHDLLNLGVHQLFHMRVPTHAAVSATVELARAVVGESRASLVNAVLRKVAAKDHQTWLDELEKSKGAEEIRYSHPNWIINAYRDALANDDEVFEMLEANNRPASVCLVARSIDRNELIDMGATPGRFSDRAAYWNGSLKPLSGLGTKSFGVQDEGSQLVTLALTRVPLEQDQRWLDLCAGPGGKAALLSAIAQERGSISVVANEIQDHRAELVRRVVGPNTEVVVGDGMTLDLSGFDRTLIDAPCSGIGALRRRPEARWRRKPRDLANLAPLQRGLLRAGIEATRPGGVIAYVTCSPHVAETRSVVEDVLNERDDLELLNSTEFLPEVPDAASGPYVQLWTHRHGVDAMFLALLQRRTR